MSGICSYTTCVTSLGEMFACASDEGLHLLEFLDGEIHKPLIQRCEIKLGSALVANKTPLFNQLEQELSEYFDGIRKEFSIPVTFSSGTVFQQKIWRMLMDIPYGTTTTYRGQALAYGDEKAIRAVASANGKNPLAVIVPCHRVIGSDGKLTGYAGGIDRKRKLLMLEKSNEHQPQQSLPF